MYFLKNFPLYSKVYLIEQLKTKYIVMMTNQRSTKIVTFMTPWARVLVLARGHIGHIVEMHFSYKNLLYS